MDQQAGPATPSRSGPTPISQPWCRCGAGQLRELPPHEDDASEACISSFVGLCSRSLVVVAGSLQAGICSKADSTTAGDDMDQQVDPCNTSTFQAYTNLAAWVQVTSKAVRELPPHQDGTCSEACISRFDLLLQIGGGCWRPTGRYLL